LRVIIPAGAAGAAPGVGLAAAFSPYVHPTGASLNTNAFLVVRRWSEDCVLACGVVQDKHVPHVAFSVGLVDHVDALQRHLTANKADKGENEPNENENENESETETKSEGGTLRTGRSTRLAP
jgi:hypothetical protein